MLSLSLVEARKLALISQGLHSSQPFGTGKEAVQRCIEQLGHVQIDTISVINRSQHQTFWARVPSYQEKHLDTLQQERRVFEYWAHAAAYLPMQDYRYCLPYMHAIASGQRHWRSPDRQAMQAVLDRVRAEGPLKAKDFEHPGQRTGDWGWNWKPAKIALEQLFIEGKLMVSHREGFQKVYDLPERVLPSGLNTRVPTATEFHRYLIQSTLRAHGLAMAPEFSYLRKGMQAGVKQLLRSMQDAGEIIPLQLERRPGTWYTRASSLDALSSQRVARSVRLLSPFDNAVIKRRRIQQLFDSDFQIECFVPAAKRRFGYYCLPILYGTELVGRLDPKADRRKREFIVQRLFLEKPVKDLEAFVMKLAETLRKIAIFNGCDRLRFVPEAQELAGRLLADALSHGMFALKP